MPECCNNLYSGWYCPRCGTPVSFIEHGGSEPVPIGQLSTKNVTVNQQLIQGDFIAAGGTKIGTNLGTAVSGNVTVGSLGDGPAPEKPLPPPPSENQKSSLPPPSFPPTLPPSEKILPPPPDMASLPPALPVLDDTLPTPPPGFGDSLPPPEM
ncbi:MAG: hypothetical protein QF707_08795 [Candidatus Poseidoniaceae archaeon]|nr:hypothetical protein [Candidatus Poseidoniaceae archaeon]